jgi:hypothetical protein
MNMTINLENSGPPLSIDDIAAFEREIDGKIPDDYKQFLLAHNGGFCEPELGLLRESQLEIIPYFDSLLPATEDAGLRYALRRLREVSPAKVDGYVPIARATSGRDICLAYKGLRAGAVFYTEFEYKTVFRGDLVPIDVTMVPLADSFTDLLGQLTEIPNPYCRIEDLGKNGTPEDLDIYLAEGNSIDEIGKNDVSILCEAIKFNNMGMIKACIERGASLSKSIYIAAVNQRPDIVQLLYDVGADVNEQDEYGYRPLACLGGTALPGDEGKLNRQLRDLLISLGATE